MKEGRQAGRCLGSLEEGEGKEVVVLWHKEGAGVMN